MYSGSSPYAPPMNMSYGPPPPAPVGAYPTPVNGSVQPNDISYGQIVGPDGRVAFQLFRAVPASFSTPNGVINGVQWMPTEAVTAPPPGAIQANPDFVASWVRSNPTAAAAALANPKDTTSYKDKHDPSSKHSRHPSDYDSLHKARDRDTKDRRSSYHQQAPVGAVPPPGVFPGAGFSGYPQQHHAMYGANPYASPYGADPMGGPTGYAPFPTSGPYPSDLAQQLGNMDLGSNKKERDRKNSEHGKRSRRPSMHEPSTARPMQPSASSDPYALPPSPSYGGGMYGPSAAPQPNMPYGVPYPLGPGPIGVASSHSSQHSRSSSRNPSPNASHTRDLSGSYGSGGPYGVPYASSGNSGRARANSTVGRSTTPADPYAPVPPKSRATTPNPPGGGAGGARPASRMAGRSPIPPTTTLPNGQMSIPESFTRPVNTSLHFAAFKPIKIQDMDVLFTQIPKLPQVLETHDVRNEDWFRFVEDIALAWTGRLPSAFSHPSASSGQPPKPALVATDLIHTWNTSFFDARGLEIVLYRGSQRRSGKLFGRYDLPSSRTNTNRSNKNNHNAHPDSEEDSEEEDSETSSSSSEDSDSDDPYPSFRPPSSNSSRNPLDEIAAARRRYYDQKQETLRRRRERRKRNRERRKNKRYTLYVFCTRPDPSSSSAAAAAAHGHAAPQPLYGGGPPGGPPPGGATAGQRGMTPAPPAPGMLPSMSTYPGFVYPTAPPPPGSMGPPSGPPPGKTKSHSRGASISGMY